ncbi:MAG: AAA family ATPase [Anaerolineales bacterium]|nr:AAA family ATPase [Anaerolineales bacterium]
MNLSQDLTLSQLKKDVHAALKQWHAADDQSEHLLAYLLLVQERQRRLDLQTPAARRLATNEVLLDGLKHLERQQPQAAQILKKRFHDQETILRVSMLLGLSQDQVKHKQREALQGLAEILFDMENQARAALVVQQSAQLEAQSYTRLFGVDGLSDKLLALLTTAVSPWVITLVGIGGIGKTSLANHTVRRAIRRLYYDEVVWLKINSPAQLRPQTDGPEQTFQRLLGQLGRQLLPALPRTTTPDALLHQLRPLLKDQAHLIIIDNLELPADTSYMLAELLTLAQPSRFLLTSRTPPADHAGSLALTLPELSEADSIALIQYYAGEIGFAEAAAASYADLLPIYQVVGGNPFALKQLVNLGKRRPLPPLLTALQERPLIAGEAIYQRILRETWLTLSVEAKAILAIMPLAAEGGMDPEQIAALSGLPEAQMWPAINELIGRSLLEVRSSQIWERYYGIHRLTELFVRSLLDGDDGRV